MPTLSQIHDNVVARSGRAERASDITGYINATLRETQSQNFFYQDMIEDEITATIDNHLWTRPIRFRKLRAVKYNNLFPTIKRKQPGDVQDGETEYFYAAGNYIVFNGTLINDTIQTAYYLYLKRLIFYSLTLRPAFYDIENDKWQYLSGVVYVDDLGTSALNEAAQALVTNWLIFNYSSLVEEGTLAKLLKSVDDKRSLISFSLYKEQQKLLIASEAWETLDF